MVLRWIYPLKPWSIRSIRAIRTMSAMVSSGLRMMPEDRNNPSI